MTRRSLTFVGDPAGAQICRLLLSDGASRLLLSNGIDFLDVVCMDMVNGLPRPGSFVWVEPLPPYQGDVILRLPRGLTASVPAPRSTVLQTVFAEEMPSWPGRVIHISTQRPLGSVGFFRPKIVLPVEPVPYAGDLYVNRHIRESIGGFSVGTSATMVWHVSADARAYKNLSPLTPSGDGDPVVMWGDLIGNNNLTPLHVPPDTISQVTNFQLHATGTGKPDIQAGSDWRGIFQGNFNFFTRTGQWSYAAMVRAAVAPMAFFDDGTPGSNGLAFGYGTNGNLDDGGGPTTTVVGIKDGAGSNENSGIVGPQDAAIIVTYDGTNSGLTNYYLCQANVSNNGGQVTSGTSFSQLGLDASGGLAIGGTYNNADPNRLAHSLSWCEAAIWSGILTPTDVQNIADRVFFYWSYN